MFLGLTQRIESTNYLDLVFINFDGVSTYFADAGVVKLDMHHEPIAIEIRFGLHNTHSMSQDKHSYRNYAAGDYSLLCYAICLVCIKTRLDDTVDSFTKIIFTSNKFCNSMKYC
jgi:hypothetical protein